MKITEELAALWLICAAGQGSTLLFDAVKAFDSPSEVYEADESELIRRITEYLEKTEKRKHPDNPKDVKTPNVGKLTDKRLSKAESYRAECGMRDIRVVPFGSEEYPSALRSIEKPPCALFVRGTLPVFGEKPAIAIVGTRDSTVEGNRFAATAAYELSVSGLIVVSGLAKGIDTYAHKGALLAGYPTVAVIAASVDNIYPKENEELYRRILENGAIVSEYLPGTIPKGYMFHMRNRIISALSSGVLVVESKVKGGSMITVAHAQEQGRVVYAVPGFPGRAESEGTNQLIRRGAVLVTSAEDIIDDMNPYFGNKLVYSRVKKPAPESKDTAENDPAEEPPLDLSRIDEIPLKELTTRKHYTDEELAAVRARMIRDLKIFDVSEPDYYHDPVEILDENGKGTGHYKIIWERPFEECKCPETPEELETFIRYCRERAVKTYERKLKAREKERREKLSPKKQDPGKVKMPEIPRLTLSPEEREERRPLEGTFQDQVYKLICESDGLSADDLCRKTGKPFAQVVVSIGNLELNDFIKDIGGGIYKAI